MGKSEDHKAGLGQDNGKGLSAGEKRADRAIDPAFEREDSITGIFGGNCSEPGVVDVKNGKIVIFLMASVSLLKGKHSPLRSCIT